MEDVFLVCFFAGLFFTVLSALMAGISSHGHGDADADTGVADADIGDVDVGDVDIGDVDVGDIDVGDVDVGDVDVGHVEASPSAEFDMGHDFDHSIADAGGDGHVEVGIADTFPGLSPWSPTVLSSFATSFGGVGFLTLTESGRSVPLSILGGLCGGVVIAGGVFYGMNKIFAALQASSLVHVADLRGLKAEVITPIPENGVGEIAYVARGTRLSAPARTVDGKPVGRADQVKIIRIAGNVYYVKPI